MEELFIISLSDKKSVLPRIISVCLKKKFVAVKNNDTLAPYKSSDMLFRYNWFAEALKEKPAEIITSTTDQHLNRNEGYGMIHFITSLVKTSGCTGYPLQTYQNIEKIVRLEVPKQISNYGEIAEWIVSHYEKV